MIDHNDMDGNAAEYVLGTLDHEERVEIDAQRSSDHELEKAILAWEDRLAPLNITIPDAKPADNLFAKIEKRIWGRPPMQASMDSKTRQWQRLALAASLACLIMSGIAFNNLSPSPPTMNFVAVLQKDAATPLFVASLDEKTSTLDVRVLTAAAPADKSYELWVIPDGEKIPRSLGVLPNGGNDLIHLNKADVVKLNEATLAVSIEPLGGSPTGRATGPVIVTGKLLRII